MKRKHLRFVQRMVLAIMLTMGMSFAFFQEGLQAQTDLQVVSVTHTTSPLVPGDSETFVIEVRNNGILPAVGAMVNFDIVDVDVIHDFASSPFPWTFLLSGAAMRTLPMPAGATETLTITVRVPSDASHQGVNQPPLGPAWASISFAGVDTNTGNNQSSTSLTSRIEANLTIQKNLLTPQVAPGGTALYDITVCNSGPSDVAGIGVTDTPGANLDFGSLEMSPGSNSLYIPAQQCRTVTATATVSVAAPVGANFGNTADINIAGLIQGPGVNAAPIITVGGSAVDNSGVVRHQLAPADVEIVSVVKTTPGPLIPGTVQRFDVTARNNGPTDAYGAVLTMLLFDAAFIPDNSFQSAGWTPHGSGGTWLRTTPWPSGQTSTVWVEVLIPSDAHYIAGDPISDFRAYVAAANPDPNPGNNGDQVNFDAQAQATLTMEVNALTLGVAPTGTALYEVTVCNNGPSDLAGLDVNLLTGPGLIPASLVTSVDASNLYVAAGQCADILVSARVAAGANIGSNICISASIAANSADQGAGATLGAQHNAVNEQACAVVQHALPPADLEAVDLQFTTGPLVPGTSETFTFTVRNNGPAPAYGATVVFNLLDTEWAIDNNGPPAGWSFFGNGTFIRTTAMPAGAEEEFSIQLLIPSDAAYAAPDLIGPFSITVAASNPDPNTGNNTISSFNIESQIQATLTIDKTLFTEEVAPGGTTLWEVTICNDGPSDVWGVSINDIPSANLGPLVTSAYFDDLYIAAGECVNVLVSAQLDITAAVGDLFCNAAEVDNAGLRQGATSLAPVVNAPATLNVCGETIFALPPVDLEVVSVVHNDSPVVPGTSESFTFTVRNNGLTYAYGATVLVDFVDVNWVVDNYFISDPDWLFFGNGVFKRTTVMQPGATETFTLIVDVPSDAYIVARPDDLGPFYVTIAASNPDPNTANNTQTLPVVTQNTADLSITKDLVNSEIRPGETAIFNIVVNNAGPSDVDQVSILDVLNGNATFLHFEPFNIDNFYVAAGQSKSFLVSVRVNDDGCGIVENCAFVSGPAYNLDVNPDNNGPSCDEFFIYDDVEPVAVVCPPATIEVNNDPGLCGAFVECEVVFTDNCDDDLLVELIKGIPCGCGEEGEGEGPGEDGPCGAFFPVGMTQVIYKATDDNGNTAFCEFMVTVIDNELPTIECPRDIVIDINFDGIATVEEGFANIYYQGPCGVTLTYEPPVASDNCGWTMINTAGLGAMDNYSVQGFGSYFSVDNWDISADGDGFVYTDVAPLSVLLQGANDGTNNAETRMCITVPIDGEMSFDWYYESQDTDGPFWDPFGYEIDGVFYQLSDNNGGAIQSGSVTINFQVGQEFCFVQSSVDGAEGPAVTITNLFVFTDNNAPNPQYYQYGGIYTEQFTVFDDSGNQAICSFTITINDNQPPTIQCPNNVVVETDPYICGASVLYPYPLGVDNCPDWFVIQLEGPAPGQIFPIGDNTVTYQITDEAGNVTICSFNVRVVDGEAPVIVECPEDREVLTSSDGLGDCCGEVPRLTNELVLTDNCADEDLPVIALFYDGAYVDTTSNCDAGAYGVYKHLQNLGFTVALVDRIDDFGQWSSALGQTKVLVIPALLGNSRFVDDVPMGSVGLLLQTFVDANGGQILMMAGGSGDNAANNVLNFLYGLSLTETCCYNGNTSYLNLQGSLYTAFQNGPVAVPHLFSTRTVGGLPVHPATKEIYRMSTNQEPTVALMPKGDGRILYFGWSFRQGGPLCDNADTEFTKVFNRALLELAGEGIIVTQSPEAFSSICGDHDEEFEVVISAVDYSGNEATCIVTLTLIDDEIPTVFPPDPITLNCEDISETADPTVIILDWLAEAYATDNCDTEPMLTYDFDVTTIDICAPAPYDITVTWTAVDDAGNSATATSTITINPDTDAPALFVPAAITLDCEDISETSSPAAIIDAWLAEAYTTDNCDTDPVLTHSFNGDQLDICASAPYDITVTWTATDHCGNSTVMSSTITIVPDTEVPFLSVPAPITLDCSDVSETSDPAAIILAWLAEAYTTDNCDTDPVLVYSFDGSEIDICADEAYDITVTWTATDHCGNSTVLSSTITIVPDTEVPFLSVPAPITLDCDDISETSNPAAIIDAWLAEAFATDNCDTDPVLTHSFDGDQLDICAAAPYDIVVTWTATDHCGNSTVLSSTITIEPDVINPELFVPAPITLDCGDVSETSDPAAIIAAWLAQANATDNCDTDPVLTHSFNGSEIDICADEAYDITVTWTATDHCGNSTVLSSTITIVPDTEDPFLFVPAAITLDCEDISETSSPAAIIDAWLAQAYTSDNCDTDPVLTHSFDGSELNICATEAYDIVVTWTATDHCGNSTVLSSTITIVPDTEDPFLFVPAPITLDCEDISETSDPAATINAWLAEAYATDDCDTDPTLSHSFDSWQLDICDTEPFVITVTWTATDHCGNSTVLSSTITVVPDTEAPELFVPAPITLDCEDISETSDPAAIIDAWLAEAYATDDCDTDPVLTHSFNGNVLDICAPAAYDIVVTWTATDHCGNSTVLSSTITVVPDLEAPDLFVPAPITLDCENISETTSPAAIIDAWLASAYATDDCDTDPVLTHSFNGNLLDICAPAPYDIIVTWTATDHCGNSTVLSSTITIIPDTEAPVITLPTTPLTLNCDDISETQDPTATILDWLAEAYATDNCDTDPVLTYDFDLTVLDICLGGTLTVTWTAVDACGNSSTASSTITVVPDTEAPVITLPTTALSLNCDDISETQDPSATILDWLAEAYATDACDTDPVLTYDFDVTTLDVCLGGTLTVTWTAVDACGNSSTASSTITVVPDTEAPVITLPTTALTLSCDDISETTDPSATILDWLAEAYATDACDTDPVLTYDFDITTLDVCVGGVLTVTWTAVDACGNSSTASSTITVVPDTDAPVFVECPTGYTFNNDVDKCGANVTWAVPVAEDACTADVVVTQTGGPAQGSFLEVGTIYMIEYTATDGCGNTAICTFPVEIVDMQNPVAICQDVVVYLDADGEASITAADVDGGSYDNCGIDALAVDITDFTCEDVGENNVILTVTDASGNSEVCVAEVSVVDNMLPTFTCPDPTTVSGCDDLIPDLVSLVTDADDNCGVDWIYQNPVAGTDFGNMSGQTVIVTVFVADVNGNVATCEVPVTIDDTVDPVYVNCPTEMHMIGNDPDQCSGKLNWSIPVAEDNCVLVSNVQVGGPLVGSIIPVCQPQTITYKATDASGNTSFCSFEVLVVDTEKPEFDADIVMPGDITVECDAIPAPFVLTNNDVNDNCTAPADLVIEFTETSTQDPNPLVCGHYNYTITRTWTVTDETCVFGGGGNQLIHVQIITVEDTTPPTALCQNITIVLDKFGNASITPDQINNGSFDNCAPAFALTYSVTPNTFTCANLGDNVVTLTVTDPCGNSSTCTAIVTVVEGIAPCVPEYAVETECLNNATTLDNGQFEELITVKSLSGQTWTVVASSGLYNINSPAPPSAPVPVANGTQLIMGNLDGIDNDGDGVIDNAEEMIYYTLSAKFVECQGYSVTLQNNLGTVGTISNNACYPTPVFVDLYNPYCISTPPFEITAVDFYGAAGVVTEVFINGVPTNIFNAADLGPGSHHIKLTFDAGDAQPYTIINGVVVAGSQGELLTDSGCEQMIETFLNVVNTPTTVACNDTIQVSLQGDCISEVTPDMILEGSYLCYDDYTVTINYPQGTTSFNPPNQVDASHIGKVLTVTLSHILSGNMCWGYIVVKDKWKPTIECPPTVDILCTVNDNNTLITGVPTVFDCSDYVLEYANVFEQFECDENNAIVTTITRTWIATDIYNNSSSCVQVINKLRGEISQVVFPADVDYACNNTPANFNPSNTGWPTIGGINLTTSGTGVCGLSVSYTDELANVCPGEYKIIRTWKINDWCTEGTGEFSTISYDQFIKVKDLPPSIQFVGQAWEYDAVNDWYWISANNWVGHPHNSCYALGPLPLAIIDGVCNELTNVEVSTPVGTTTNGGIMPWPGLGIGLHQLTYVAEDECGNITSVTITINVIDNVAPIAICDEITDVNLSSDGFAIVNASVLDDGSYDNCCLDYFEARRMDGDCDGNFDEFGPTVEFCCSDAGQAITVIFRAYDCYGNFNDCMVTVNVSDKLPPIIISCPQNQTITCDDYLQNYAAGVATGDYSVLSGFGTPTFYDNCGYDVTPNVTVNIDNCSQGTIVRTWQANDGSNTPVTCTQTITVTHVNNWEVLFPADVMVECVNGQLPDTGEPQIFFDECELIGVSFEDQLFDVVPDACYKIVRTWTVINWCVYSPTGNNTSADDILVSPRRYRSGADGWVQYKQTIKVVDNEAPAFTIPAIDGCILDTDCDTDLSLPYPDITDECSPEFTVNITGDFGTFNNISGAVIVPNVGVGTYEVTYAVSDNCGNTSYETVVIEVEDCKKPTPICKNGLIAEIMQTQMVEVFASQLNDGSFDNCGPVIFSFSPDTTNTSIVYTCDDLGQNPVQIWVTDIYGNQDFCNTFVIVQNNMGACGGGVPVIIAGVIATELDAPVEDVEVMMNGGLFTDLTDLAGEYSFSVMAGNDYSVTPMLDENASNGVTTFDMVLITRHILNVQQLDSPYKIIAADANNSGTVTTLDLVAIRKVILVIENNFPNNTSWRFVDKDYIFPNASNPWADPNGFPEVINYNNIAASDLAADFVAVKVGDVNGTAATNFMGSAEERTMMGDLVFNAKDMKLAAGNVYEVPFFGDDQAVSGYQFTIELGEGLELIEVREGVASEENFGFALLENGALTTSWNDAAPRTLGSDEEIFTLVLRAKANTMLSEELSVSSRYTVAEAYNSSNQLLNVQFAFGNEIANGFELYQNIPNPFTGVTRIGFRLPEASTATLSIMDVSGKVLKVVRGEFAAGYNEVNVSDFGGATGVLYYKLDTPSNSATRKMIILE